MIPSGSARVKTGLDRGASRTYHEVVGSPRQLGPANFGSIKWMRIRMAAVKGSKQLKMVVVPHRPWRTRLALFAFSVVLVLPALFGYYFGHYRALAQQGDAMDQRDALEREVQSLRNGNAVLEGQNLSLQQAASVDKEALSSVQRTIVSLRSQISQLEEDVLFYKQVLSPGNDETGLVIGQLDLVAGEGLGDIRYRLELKQQGNNDNFIRGHVNVNVIGLQDGEEVTVPLRDLSDSVGDLDIKLQFRYFQNVEGQLLLPAGFEPQKVRIVAVAEGENAKTIQKSFGWLLQN